MSRPDSVPPPSSDRPSANLALRPPKGPNALDEVSLQQLWISLQQKPWRSLAVIAADKGIATLDVANALASIAWSYTGNPTCVFDMRDVSLRLLEHQMREMASQLRGGERVFVALRSCDENPTALPLARAADAAVLCVELQRTDVKAAQKTLETVGRERFIGTIMVRPPAGAAPAKKSDKMNLWKRKAASGK